MRALTLAPGEPASAFIEDIPEPGLAEGSILLETLAIGICGTDLEMISGNYGSAPPGKNRLVLGHEALGRVLDAPSSSGLVAGELVASIVRHPDPLPCANCSVGEWDMCRNGRYTERGIKERDGFCCERFRAEPEFLVKVAPHLGLLAVLIEPASVLAKAWEHIEHIGKRACWTPRRCLITGAGPIGLLAALMGRQRDLEVHIVDRHTAGPKPLIAQDLGAHYHSEGVKELASEADVIVECTGSGQLLFEILQSTSPGAITCLTGISAVGRLIPTNLSAVNKSMVLENEVIFGSVNANRRHYEQAACALAAADVAWLRRLVNRTVPLESWREAVVRQTDDVKPVIQLAPL